MVSADVASLPDGKSQGVCSVSCVQNTGKRYTESFPLVLKDKSCFSEGERSTVQLPLDHMFALQNT